MRENDLEKEQRKKKTIKVNKDAYADYRTPSMSGPSQVPHVSKTVDGIAIARPKRASRDRA